MLDPNYTRIIESPYEYSSGPFQLRAWQDSHQLNLQIYRLSNSFPKAELFGITSQLRRTSCSVVANLSEGFGRQGIKSKLYFYNIAFASLMEAHCFLMMSKDLGYLRIEDFKKLEPFIGSIQVKINALQKTLRKKLARP